jgi:DNA invertase Pin-like site-specific DNA recombinase
MPRHSTIPTGYSYVRFSSKKQEQGDSRRRQTDGRAEAYCKKRGWRLSGQTYEDLGVSAFRGKNALVGNLGEFLRAIREGSVRPGSALIVESLDRITRQGIDEGYDLIKQILKADVRIVTLSPEREFDRDATRSLSKGALEIQLILERAAEESERKGERVAAARQQERLRIRETGEVVTRQLPAWITEGADGKPAIIPKKAAAVRQLFTLAASGYGTPSIVAKLIRDKVPPITREGRWTKSYVSALLRDRRVLGELQLYKGDQPDGEPVREFFPPAITEAEWLATRAAATARKRYPNLNGRIGKERVNVFSGLVKHARDGDSYQMTTCRTRGPGGETIRYQVLINSAGMDGTGRGYSIPYEPFERAILSCLQEIDPREVLNEAKDGIDEVADLETLHDGVEAELASAVAFMEANGFSPAIGKRITELEARKQELSALLAEARHEAEHPLHQTWDDAKSLMAVIEQADDPVDRRLRLRAALRRITDSILLLVVRRGLVRVCAIQIHFRQGKRRDYLVLYRQASKHGGKPVPSAWWVRSFTDVVQASNLDLRDRNHVERVERTLMRFDLDSLAE